jgi:hypothetical protein
MTPAADRVLVDLIDGLEKVYDFLEAAEECDTLEVRRAVNDAIVYLCGLRYQPRASSND